MTSFALRHYQHATPPVSALRIMTRHDLWRMSILGATPSMLRGNAADDYVVRSGNLRCLRSHVPDNILWKSDILNLKANKRQSTGCVNARSCSKQQREGQHCTWKRCRKRPSQQTTGKSCHTEMFEGCDFLLPQTTCTSIFQLHADRTNPSFSCCSHLRGQLWFQDQRVLTFPLNYSHSVSTSVPKLHGLSQPLSASQDDSSSTRTCRRRLARKKKSGTPIILSGKRAMFEATPSRTYLCPKIAGLCQLTYRHQIAGISDVVTRRR